jgi:hypothetical protein
MLRPLGITKRPTSPGPRSSFGKIRKLASRDTQFRWLFVSKEGAFLGWGVTYVSVLAPSRGLIIISSFPLAACLQRTGFIAFLPVAQADVSQNPVTRALPLAHSPCPCIMSVCDGVYAGVRTVASNRLTMLVFGYALRAVNGAHSQPPQHGCILAGAVAQLGERLVRNEEVRGSTPLGSTSLHRSAAGLARHPPKGYPPKDNGCRSTPADCCGPLSGEGGRGGGGPNEPHPRARRDPSNAHEPD